MARPYKKKGTTKTKALTIRITPEELESLQSGFRETPCRSMNEYTSKRLLAEPLTVFYRNKSADEVLEKLVNIKNVLTVLADRFRTPAFRTGETKSWKLIHQADTQDLFQQIQGIKSAMNQLYEHVSQNPPGPQDKGSV